MQSVRRLSIFTPTLYYNDMSVSRGADTNYCAVASKVRIENPLFSSILFGVHFGLIAWGGIYWRDERLRTLFPFRR
jgi:hypothetical protein